MNKKEEDIPNLTDLMNRMKAEYGVEWKKYLKGYRWQQYEYRNREESCRRIAHYILQRLFVLMADDLIYDDVQFDFYVQKKLWMSWLIADRDKKSLRYRFKFERQGHCFIPYIVQAPILWKKTKRYMVLYLRGIRYHAFYKQRKYGHYYAPTPELDLDETPLIMKPDEYYVRKQ